MSSLEDWLLEAVMAVLIAIGGGHWRMYQWIKRLHEMHENPEKHGFGTEKTNEILEKQVETQTRHLEEIARATRDSVHYTKWFVETQSGKAPPPPTA